MSELEKAILKIREDISSINTKLENLGPRIGEASLCRYHSEQLEKLGSKLSRWTGAISVLSFIVGILVPVIFKHIFK